MNPIETCATCKFWHDDGTKHVDGRTFGQCRRYAPNEHRDSIVSLDDTGQAGTFVNRGCWTRTENADWCGDFSVRLPRAA